ncbi:MAG TPA: hypothetical protein ENK62_05860 [Chromatiales bacterium]|nr:hypothetical protein [Chromatiales bacterium]
MSLTIALHVLATVIWVGGMFFAHQCLRPAAVDVLDPPQRLRLWRRAFARFFPWVWVCVAVLLATGLWMMFGVFGGFQGPLYVHVMFGIGLVMMAIFMHVYFAPYRRLVRAVVAEDWSLGARALAQIRVLIGVNLSLGLLVVAIASAGRYLAF